MSIYEEYKEMYEKEIKDEFSREIEIYKSCNNGSEFIPISHNCKMKCINCERNCYKSLGKLMRKNLVYYCYGEQEVVDNVKNRLFSNLEKATLYAYKNRLPKRLANQDGLPSEVLFDLLIQNLVPNAYKLAVRTIYRQDDNNEIKGYDLTYFTNDSGKISLWLGQAKLGGESYCKSGINDDLILKFTQKYLSKQIFFISEKQCGLSKEGIELTNIINQLNMINIEKDDNERTKAFIDFISKKNIIINIPCLLAYGKDSVYGSISDVKNKINKEVQAMKKYFAAHTYIFKGFTPNLMFFVFPIENLEGLRGEEGFYEGLH